MNKNIKIGIDIGSTTVKVVVLDTDNHVISSDYRRHNMNVRETVQTVLQMLLTCLQTPLTVRKLLHNICKTLCV